MKGKISLLLGIGIGVLITVGFISLVAATSTEEVSHVKARAVYAPNSEDLGPGAGPGVRVPEELAE